GVHGDRAEHVVHDHVAHAHLLHHASAVPPGLQPDAPVGTLEDAVADGDVAHPAAHLAASHHPTVPVDHRATRDHDVLATYALRGSLGAGLDRDAVIAVIDMAVADAHIAAGLGVDAIGVRGIRRVGDAHPGDRHVLAQRRMDRPGGRVAQEDVPDGDPLAV